MTKAIDLSSSVQVEIEAHLDEVDRVLQQSQVSRSERRALCDELECQIMDILSQRCSHDPAIADVRALLAEMDAPSSFARLDGDRQPNSTVEPKVLPLAIGAAITAVSGIVFAFVWAQWRGAESDRQQAAIIAFLVHVSCRGDGVNSNV